MEWTKASKKRLAGRLRALKPFDPYHSALCTCGPKLTLNVYTGCGYECLYCYTSTYSYGRWGRDSDRWGPRADVVANVGRDVARIERDEQLRCLRGLPVVLSLSSDLYPDTPHVREAELGLTRQCLRILADAGHPILLQTKSDLLMRDLDLLEPGRAVVGVTITTLDAELARKLEPYAPTPERRLAALQGVARRGVATLCRVDPLLPGVNDDEEGLGTLMQALAGTGVNQVVSSTFKLRRDSAVRFRERFPDVAAAVEPLYDSKEIAGYRYLTEPERRRRMERARALAEAHGLAFSCCREGMPELNAASCDGQHWLRQGAASAAQPAAPEQGDELGAGG
jgi:DNA repair photolyase